MTRKRDIEEKVPELPGIKIPTKKFVYIKLIINGSIFMFWEQSIILV